MKLFILFRFETFLHFLPFFNEKSFSLHFSYLFRYFQVMKLMMVLGFNIGDFLENYENNCDFRE